MGIRKCSWESVSGNPPVCRCHTPESLRTHLFNLRTTSSSLSSMMPPYLKYQQSAVSGPRVRLTLFSLQHWIKRSNIDGRLNLLQRTNNRILRDTCAILRPEKLIRELMVLSLRNFIVVSSLSVQIDSSISFSLGYEEMSGKTYSAKECSAAALQIQR